mgnify:CR=1 FL=1
MPYTDAADGTRLYFESAGSGAPVLLLTGAFSTVEDWHESGVFAELARERRVIAMDLRGHGKSGVSTGRKAAYRNRNAVARNRATAGLLDQRPCTYPLNRPQHLGVCQCLGGLI